VVNEKKGGSIPQDSRSENPRRGKKRTQGRPTKKKKPKGTKGKKKVKPNQTTAAGR